MALASRLRPWVPLPLLFGTYQLAGWLGRRISRPPADGLLLAWDRMVFGTDPGVWMAARLPRPVLSFFDLFYFSYYLLLIVGPWAAARRYGDGSLRPLWTAVGAAFLVCYGLFPWFPSTPPRLRFAEFAYGGWPQRANLWILNRFSVHGNVFPSAHVAAGFSFAYWHLARDGRLGALFLLWAFGIAVSTVSGGYHFGVDAAGGALVGLTAAMAASRTGWARGSGSSGASRSSTNSPAAGRKPSAGISRRV